MNNHDIPVAFIQGKLPYATNGRGNFKFKDNVLYSYDDVIAVRDRRGLLVNSDTFSATSSRHQSAIKRVAPVHMLVPDLTCLVKIMQTKDAQEAERYVFRRRLAISELQRRIEASKSADMIEILRRQIDQQKKAAKIALRYVPFDRAIQQARDFFRSTEEA